MRAGPCEKTARNGRWPGWPRAEGGGDHGRSQDWRGRLCQPLSEYCLYAGGDRKPVKGLEKGVTFRGYWIYIWAPSPVKATGPEASSPSLLSSANGYGIPRLTDQGSWRWRQAGTNARRVGPPCHLPDPGPVKFRSLRSAVSRCCSPPPPSEPPERPSPSGRLPCAASARSHPRCCESPAW